MRQRFLKHLFLLLKINKNSVQPAGRLCKSGNKDNMDKERGRKCPTREETEVGTKSSQAGSRKALTVKGKPSTNKYNTAFKMLMGRGGLSASGRVLLFNWQFSR